MSTTKNVEKIDEEMIIPPDTEKETITEGKKPVDFMRIIIISLIALTVATIIALVVYFIVRRQKLKHNTHEDTIVHTEELDEARKQLKEANEKLSALETQYQKTCDDFNSQMETVYTELRAKDQLIAKASLYEIDDNVDVAGNKQSTSVAAKMQRKEQQKMTPPEEPVKVVPEEKTTISLDEPVGDAKMESDMSNIVSTTVSDPPNRRKILKEEPPVEDEDLENDALNNL